MVSDSIMSNTEDDQGPYQVKCEKIKRIMKGREHVTEILTITNRIGETKLKPVNKPSIDDNHLKGVMKTVCVKNCSQPTLPPVGNIFSLI